MFKVCDDDSISWGSSPHVHPAQANSCTMLLAELFYCRLGLQTCLIIDLAVFNTRMLQ
jgi:hypothetical protein